MDKLDLFFSIKPTTCQGFKARHPVYYTVLKSLSQWLTFTRMESWL